MKPAATAVASVVFALALAAPAAGQGAADVLTIGTASAYAGVRTAVPVYLRDVSGTPLGVDKSSKIQNIVFTVNFSDPSKISGCSEPQVPECAVTFRATSFLKAPHTLTLAGSSSIEVQIQVKADDPTDYTLDKAAPGDQIGDLMVTGDDDEGSGGTVAFTLDGTPGATFLAGPLGSNVKENAGNGLQLVSGSFTLCPLKKPADLAIKYTSTACSSTQGGTCMPGAQITFEVSSTSYEIQTCDSVSWDFGDGTFGTGTTTTHTYSGTQSSFDVTATLSNPLGDIPAAATIPMTPAQVVCLCNGTPPASIDIYSPATFTAASTTCTASQYEWDFGDGSPHTFATVPAVAHTYTTSGSKNWSVTIKTFQGPMCIAAGTIDVNPVVRRRSARTP